MRIVSNTSRSEAKGTLLAKCIELHFQKKGECKMKYTLSFDASVKLNKQNVTGLIYHNFRDVLEAEGKILNHRNESIDPSRTTLNESIYYNQHTHCFEKCTDIHQIEKSMDKRLAMVKKPLRKDAVLARSIVLQLDGEWYSQNDTSKHPNLDMLQWAIAVFGEENIIGASIHKDEANPHLHILFTPVTKDGRLSQKDWFKDPKSLKDMHESFRDFMEEKGYPIERSRQPKRKHMSEQEYKTYREAVDIAESLSTREAELKYESERILVEANKVFQQAQGELIIAQQYANSVKNIYERFKDTVAGKKIETYVKELEKLDETLLPNLSRSKQKDFQLG